MSSLSICWSKDQGGLRGKGGATYITEFSGAELFIEVGPKKVLSNMLKDIDPSIPRLNVEDVETIGKTVRELAA